MSAPSGALGEVGDVFFGFRNVWWSAPSCYIKTASGWTSVGGTTTLTNDQIQQAITNDPGPANDKHRPQLVFMTTASASQICSAQPTDYGNKRLLRHREYIVSTPLPYIPGEDNFTSSTLAFNAPNNTTCNPYPSTSSWPTNLSSWLSSSNPFISMYYNSTTPLNAYDTMLGTRYFIGSTATSNCVSRFGIQDPLGFGVIFSDAFVRLNSITTLPPTVQASSSDFDSGNMDNGNFSINGIMGPAFPNGPSASYYSNQVYSLSSINSCSALGTPPVSFIPAVGLPVCSLSGTQNLRTVVEFEKTGQLGSYATYGTGVSTFNSIANDSVSSYVMSSGHYGRYSFSIVSASTYDKYGNLLCAVEAE